MFKLEFPGYVCWSRKFGFVMLVVPDQFFEIKKNHGGSKRDVQPFSSEPCLSWRRAGAKDYYITGDFHRRGEPGQITSLNV